VDDAGKAPLVDVSDKPVSARTATALGRVKMSPQAFAAVQKSALSKGDVLTVAQVAGITAGKRTGELIPLCHPLGLDGLDVNVALEAALPGVVVEATARATGRTGVEMEALTAVAVACLTVYDMVKAVDRSMVIEQVRLISKTGGTRGDWQSADR
jgi:cyclic pyranopterin phosphate synthase